MTGIKDKDNNDGDNSMILANLYNRFKVSLENISKIISIPNPSSTQRVKEITIDGEIYCQVNTSFI